MSLRDDYRPLHTSVLVPLAERLQTLLSDHLADVPRIDRISTRAKSVDRFVAKAEKKDASGQPKYGSPLTQIQDQVGARVITFYLSDVDTVAERIRSYFTAIEQKQLVPESESEFGYVGKHFILFFPRDLFDRELPEDSAPKFFELQIRTLFQHAWSEANHDLGYKSTSPLSTHQRRRLAFTAAQAWGADEMFQQLHRETLMANGS